MQEEDDGPWDSRSRLQDIDARYTAVFRAQSSGPEAVLKAYHLAMANFLRDQGFLIRALKEAWMALETLQGSASALNTPAALPHDPVVEVIAPTKLIRPSLSPQPVQLDIPAPRILQDPASYLPEQETVENLVIEPRDIFGNPGPDPEGRDPSDG